MKKLNILIPIAGFGAYFEDYNHSYPKPLIEILGKPMVQIVCNNLEPKRSYDFIFVISGKEAESFALEDVLLQISPSSKIVKLEGKTAGAACSALLAHDWINNEDPLIIANGDQFLDFDINDFVEDAFNKRVDGGIVTFDSIHPKWSFVRLNEQGLVTEIAEKKPISRNATAGIYFFNKGLDFVKAAQEMIKKGASVNNQFYVCPVYNEMILKNKKISTYRIDNHKVYKFSNLDDVKEFEKKFRGQNNF